MSMFYDNVRTPPRRLSRKDQNGPNSFLKGIPPATIAKVTGNSVGDVLKAQKGGEFDWQPGAIASSFIMRSKSAQGFKRKYYQEIITYGMLHEQVEKKKISINQLMRLTGRPKDAVRRWLRWKGNPTDQLVLSDNAWLAILRYQPIQHSVFERFEPEPFLGLPGIEMSISRNRSVLFSKGGDN